MFDGFMCGVVGDELKMPHVMVATLYMLLQLVVSLVAVYLIPDTITVHWIYLGAMCMVLGLGYIAFVKKYYHLRILEIP